MPTDEPHEPGTGQRRCPVCWTWFTPNAASNPHPKRYCSGACRIEDSRRRREREQTQLLLDAKLDVLSAARHAEAERLQATRADSSSTNGDTP
jgi:predicted nucleic acid-binding Zn ribbon protein